MATIRIADVRKSYGKFAAIHGLSLEIDDGEFVILVGPSGCGKSTLLRMIAGLESITGGKIFIGDRAVNNLPPRQRDIAMVFQSYALYPHMTVAQNMGFSLKLAGRSKDEIDTHVRSAADILDITRLLDRKPAQLSGGQRQRVAMGRCIVRDPKVFLFDEPLSNLDAKLRVQMRGEIKGLHNRLSSTIVYVTHDQVEAMTMADRIVVMNSGDIEQIGTPTELYDQPRSLFVAGFIGSPSMNLFEGEIAHDASGIWFEGDAGGRIALSPDAPLAEPGRPVVLGVRPENLVPANDTGDRIAAEVALVESTGSETLITARFGTENLTVLVRERMAVHPGEQLKLAFKTPDLHLFDRSTGLRVV